MKSKSVNNITSNEEYVRMKIFDGDLQIDEAGAELLRLERAQHEVTRKRLLEANEYIEELLKKLVARGSAALPYQPL